MNFLDRAISSVAPSWGVKRAQSRLKIKAYEAANPSRTHKAPRQSRSANASIWSDGRSMREQSRWLDENHDLVIGIYDKLEERVVGADGIMVEPQPLDESGKLHREFASELRRRWASWSLKPEVTGVFSRPELERLILRSALRDGEVFGQLVRGKVGGLVHPNPNGTQFSIEALEADFVPMGLSDLSERIHQGIGVNAWGQPQFYVVYHNHPGGTVRAVGATKRVSADKMIHLAYRRRLHQLRGVTMIHGIITRLHDVKEYEEAERVAARIAACLGFYIKKDGVAEDFNLNGDSESTERRQIDIAPGMLFDDLEPGEDIGMIESNRPNTHLAEFRNGQVRMIAAGTRSSYSSVSRDYGGTYSSQRQELVESQDGFNVLQNWFICNWARPVYREWLRMELLNGLEIPSDLDIKTLHDAVYLAPVMPWINPIHETQSWKERVKGGAASTAQWIRADGKNPEETWRQIQSEREHFKNNNLNFDTTTGESSSESQQTTSGSESDASKGDGSTGDDKE